MKKYVLNSWIFFLSLPLSMHKDCIENYDSRCVNLPAISGKLAHQYYNLVLPRISYLFTYLKLHFSSKSY